MAEGGGSRRPILNFGKRSRTYNRNGRRWKSYGAWVRYEGQIPGRRDRDERWFRSEGDRDDWLRVTLATGRAQSTQRSKRETVGQLLEDWYQHGCAVKDWSLRHRATMRWAIDRHLDYLAEVPIDKLEVDHVEHLIARAIGQGATPNSLRHVRNALRAALNLAIRRGKLDRNVAQLAEVPVVRRRPPKVIALDVLPAFLEAIEGERLGAFWQFSLAMAVRPAEAIGLRWGDVDLRASVATFRRTIQHDPGVGPVERTTKTDEQRRVAIPDDIVQRLRRHRAELRRDGLGWRTGDLVFPNRKGQPLYGPTAYRRLRHVLKQKGLPAVTLYQLRHTGATLRLAAGVPLEVVQEDLGHRSITMTRRYVEIAEPMRHESAERMNAVLAAARAVGGNRRNRALPTPLDARRRNRRSP